MIKQLLVIGFIILLTMTLTYFVQRQLIYFPAKETPDRKNFHAEDMEEVRLRTMDGLSLLAWYKPATNNNPTLLYLHGNAGHIGFRMPLVRQFLNAGLGVLLLEYRGYGGNKGNPTEKGLYLDGHAAMQFLLQKKIPADRLILYGESLGTGVATQLASELSICALILQSPFTSLTAMARYHYPWVFIQPLDKFDSFGRISLNRSPLLILHGKSDTIVPFKQAIALFNQANEPKSLIPIEGKGHNDLWDNDFAMIIISFIKSNCR